MASSFFLRALAVLVALLATVVGASEPHYRLGAEDSWYPYSALRDGKVQDMSVDLVRAAFAASDITIELVPYPYVRCMQMTRTGQLAGCFNTSPDKRIRAQYLLAEEALFSDDILLWARRQNAQPITDLAQLKGRRVAVTIGYEYGSAFDSRTDVQRILVRRDLSGFLMLERQRVDYTAAYRGTAEALFQQRPKLAGLFTPVATLHQPQLFISFSRNHPHASLLRERFDSGMRELHRNGTYQKIVSGWRAQIKPL